MEPGMGTARILEILTVMVRKERMGTIPTSTVLTTPATRWSCRPLP
jgi:hypothetical protein